MNIAATQETVPAESPKCATVLDAAAMRERLTRNVGGILVARGGYLISRVLVPPFVVARIGLQAYGLWSAVFIVVSYIGFSTLGVSSAYVKYVAEYVANGQMRKANSLLSTGIVMTSAIGIVVFLITVMASPWIVTCLKVPPQAKPEASRLLFLIVAMFVTGLSLSVFNDSLVGSQKIAETQVIYVITYSIETILIFVLVGAGYGIMGLVLAFAVRLVVGIALSAYLAFKLQPWLRLSPRLCSREPLGTLFSFGGIVQLSFLLSIGLSTVERVIAAPLIGLEAVGLLDLSDKLPTNAASVSGAFGFCFMPAASHMQASALDGNGNPGIVLKLYLKGARYMTMATAIMLGLLVTASGPIMTMWTGKVYPGAGLLLAIFAVQQQFHSMTGPGTQILKGLGRPVEDFFYIVPNIILLALTVPASHLIVGHWSVVGLGGAVVAATLFSSVVFLLRAHRLLEVPWKKYMKSVALPASVPYVVGAICAWPLWSIVPRVSRLHAIGVLFVVGIFYLLVLFVAVDRLIFDADEREWLRSIVRRWTTLLFSRGLTEGAQA